jgi:uncharacterized protein (DUF302 family)
LFHGGNVILEAEPNRCLRDKSEGKYLQTNAYNAICAEENIGLMLPCNVIIYEKGSKKVLSVIRPAVAMQMINNVELQKLAEAVKGQLKKAFDDIK